MVQPEERLTARISFYTKPSIDERLDKVVTASPWDKPDWLRHWLEDTLVRLETEEVLGEATPESEVAAAPVAVQLAAAQAQIAGLEHVNALLTERLGLADAQNIELNKRLEEAHSTVDRAMLALPAPSGGDGPTRRRWQFWKQ